MCVCARRISTSRRSSSTTSGWCRAHKSGKAIYYRGTDPVHHVHITEKGDPKFVGIAYHAASEDDLKTLAKVPGASGIENLDEPGGGKRVRLTEPNGYQIEVVWGMDKVAEIPAPRQLLNSGYAPLAREGDLMRIQKGPSRVQARRPRRARHAEGEGDRQLVPPPSRLHLLRRRLRRRRRTT